ncbi:hypothetical protein F383_11612 [Gossypium arboreum]|uniref:Uncharacterized protein n=1 Tax=Gossypium arboreum TaxID=29729 RepID=A0A0B0PX24_GOSAR|nr:hypothetical protein F383_11612 [Gossypium arboreum]
MSIISMFEEIRHYVMHHLLGTNFGLLQTWALLTLYY